MVQELAIEIENLEAFVLDKPSLITNTKTGLAAKLRKDFASTMINIHCICHRFALAYANCDYKLQAMITNSYMPLHKKILMGNFMFCAMFLKISSKRLKNYIRIVPEYESFDIMLNKQ